MPLEELRVWAAFIRDVVFIGILLVALIVMLVTYWQVSRLIKTARRLAREAEEVMNTVSEKVVRPASAGSGVAFGLGKVLAFLSGLRRGK